MRLEYLLMLSIFSFSLYSNGLKFKDVKDIALERNRNLQISALEVKKSEAKMKESWASFYPSINLQSSYTRLLTVPEFEIETPQGTQTLSFGFPDNYTNSLSLTFPVFTFGRRLVMKSITDRSLEIQQFQEETDKINLIMDLSTVFYGVVSANEGVEISKEAVDRAADHLNTAKIQYREGRVTKLDLLSAETELNQRTTEYLNSQNGLDKARSALNILLGLPLDTLISIEGEIDLKPDTFELDSLINKAIKERPEIKSIEKLNEVANLNNRLQLLDYLPTVVFQGNLSYDKPHQFENEWGADVNATIALSFPIFDGFARPRKMDQYIITARQSIIREELIKEGIRMEIKNLLLDYGLNKKKLKLAEKELETAKEAYEMAKEQYEKGYISFLDYKDIELGYRSAEFSHLNALYNLSVSLSKIKIATMEEL
jgi:outer membrane protein TolC